MKHSQAARAMHTFDSLPVTTKNEIFNEMLNLGLRISYGETTWHRHIRQRAKQTKGPISRFYSAMTNFSPSDVNTFLAEFSEKSEENKMIFIKSCVQCYTCNITIYRTGLGGYYLRCENCNNKSSIENSIDDAVLQWNAEQHTKASCPE